MLTNVKRFEEREIFEMTGCMPGCSKSKFELSIIQLRDGIDDVGEEASIRLKYLHGEHELAEEYYLYDIDSFIPDVGGYLGLLLGYSLLSMYHTFTEWLLNSKLVKLFVCKKT